MTYFTCCTRADSISSFSDFNSALENIREYAQGNNDIVMREGHPRIGGQPGCLERLRRAKALERYIDDNQWIERVGLPNCSLSEKAEEGLILLVSHPAVGLDPDNRRKYGALLSKVQKLALERLQIAANAREAAHLDEVMAECEGQIARCTGPVFRVDSRTQWEETELTLCCRDGECQVNWQAMSTYSWEAGYWNTHSVAAAELVGSLAEGELVSACVTPELREELLQIADELDDADLLAAVQHALRTGVQTPHLSERLSQDAIAEHKNVYQNILQLPASQLWQNDYSTRPWTEYKYGLLEGALAKRSEAKKALLRGMYDPQAACIVGRLERLMALQKRAAEKALMVDIKFPSGRQRWFDKRAETADHSYACLDGSVSAHSQFLGTDSQLDLSLFNTETVTEFVRARYGLNFSVSDELFRLALQTSDWDFAQSIYDELTRHRDLSVDASIEFLKSCPTQINAHRHIARVAYHIAKLACVEDRAESIPVSHILRMNAEAFARATEAQIWEVLRPYVYRHPEFTEQFFRSIDWRHCSRSWIDKIFGVGGPDASVFLPSQVKEMRELAVGDGKQIRNGMKGDFVLLSHSDSLSYSLANELKRMITLQLDREAERLTGAIVDGGHYEFSIPYDQGKITWVTTREHGRPYGESWDEYVLYHLKLGELVNQPGCPLYLDGNLSIRSGYRSLPKTEGELRVLSKSRAVLD